MSTGVVVTHNTGLNKLKDKKFKKQFYPLSVSCLQSLKANELKIYQTILNTLFPISFLSLTNKCNKKNKNGAVIIISNRYTIP